MDNTILLLFAVFLTGTVHCTRESEVACSKFDYEEKLLAKSIRLENTVDDLASRLRKAEKALEESEALNSKITDIVAKLNATVTKLTESEEKAGEYVCMMGVCVYS